MIANPLSTRKIVFYDWDNKVIGVLILPVTWADVRAPVNFFVGANMIHPETRDGDMKSLERTHNYRGKYPHLRPMKLGEGEEYCREDGPDYPLTNKLDYVFLKRKMKRLSTIEGYLDKIELFVCPSCGDLSIVWPDSPQAIYPPAHKCRDTVSGKYGDHIYEKVTKDNWSEEQCKAVMDHAFNTFVEQRSEANESRPAFQDPWEAERLEKRERAKRDWPRREIYPEESFYYVVTTGAELELRHGLRYCPGKYIKGNEAGSFKKGR